MKRLLSILLTVVLLAGLVSLPAQAVADTWYGTVEGGWLRLRAGASFSADTVNSYNVGTVVEILDTNGDWYKVKTPDGSVGYMYSKYLARGGSYAGSSSYTGVTNATVVSANGYGVRLRQGPSTSYRIIRKYPVGTRAEIIEQGSYWSRIRIEGRMGYMMNRFLSRDGGITPPGPHYDGDATVWSSNGYGVRLRTGPGTSYRKIGVYSVGTQVSILSKGSVWDYVQIGSRVGYMMNKFLIYNNNYNVSGVTINNYNPVVGNILSVQTVTPSSATVTFQWYADKEKRGTDASYTVSSADVGKQMRLVVSGIGYYSGYAVSDPTAAVVGTGTVTAVTLNITQPYAGNILRAETITPTGATVSYQWKNAADNTILGTGETYTVTADDATNNRQIYLTVTGINTYNGTATSVTTSPAQPSAAPTITTTALANATKGASYKDTLKAVGGGSGFTWSIASGTLPAGLSLNASTGVISGTVAATATTQTVTFKVSNGISPDATLALPITVQDQVSAPVFTPDGGSFDKLQAVTLTCATAGASIYYTTDGKEPTASSTLYHTPFFLANTTTVKAVAILGGLSNSAVVTKVFTLTKTVEPEFSPAGGAYTAAQNVTITCDTTGASIYYTTDGTTPTTASTKYAAPIALTTSMTYPITIKAIGVTPGVANSGVAEATYILSSQSSYTVTLDMVGGSLNNGYSSTFPYTVGKGVALPVANGDVTKANFAFAGWYTNSGYTGSPVTQVSATDVGDKTFYAKWVASETFGISYFHTNGTTIILKPDTYVKGQTMALPTKGVTPLTTGKVFEGWYKEAALTNKVTQIAATDTDVKTFYAKFVDAPSYRINFVFNGQTYSEAAWHATYVEGVGTALPDKVNGADFSGWYDSSAMTGTPITSISAADKADKTFYGGGVYTVTLDVNGGEGSPTTQTVTYGKTPADLTALPTPPNGQVFGGYYDGTAAAGTQYYDKDGKAVRMWNKGADTTLYAYYANPARTLLASNAALTVTYKSNGGDGADYVDTCDAATGLAVIQGNRTTQFSKDGFTFVGWNTAADGSGTAYAPGQTVTASESLELFAQWSETLTVTYDYNGMGGESTSHTVDFVSGQSVTMPPADYLTGYTIAGWEDGTANTTYTPGQEVTFTDSITLRAIRATEGEEKSKLMGRTMLAEPSDVTEPTDNTETVDIAKITEGDPADNTQDTTKVSYTVTYYVSDTIQPQVSYQNGEVTVSAAPPVDGFLCWNTQQGAREGEGIAYAPGAQFTIAENITLYAIFPASAPNTDTNTDGNGNTETNTDTQTDTTTNASTQTDTNTNPQTQTDTTNNTPTETNTQTETNAQTDTNTNTNTDATTNTNTQPDTATNTDTQPDAATETEGQQPAATYSLTYYTGDGTQIAPYTYTESTTATVGGYPKSDKAKWNTQRDGKGLTYVTNDPIVVDGIVALYYVGPATVTQPKDTTTTTQTTKDETTPDQTTAETKTETTPETKTDTKTDTAPETKTETKTDTTTETKPETATDTTKPATSSDEFVPNW